MAIDVAAPGLEVRDLRLIAALCKGGTTRAAGEILHLAQPTVSRALLALEDRMETELFARTPRGLVPTAAGLELERAATELLQQFIDLERAVRAVPPTEERIRVACECYTAYHWLPTVLPEIEQAHPELRLELRVEYSGDPLGALADGSIDVALVTTPTRADGDAGVCSLFADELLFVVGHKMSALARRRTLTPDDLRAHRLFSAAPTRSEADWFMSTVFGRARPRLRLTPVPLTSSIVELAASGLGIGLVSEWVLAPHRHRDDVSIKRLRSGRLERPWRMAYRQSCAPVARKLANSLRRHARAQRE